MSLKDKSILLVISGGIAAYKALELIRLIRKNGGYVRAIITHGGQQFVTPLSVSALCEEQAYTDLWSLKDETEMGHIRLSREADLIVVAPASADFLAKLAHGRADDLASTTLLAADKPIFVAPAMNHKMWDNAATQANIQTLQARGVQIIGPHEGDMACGEYGMGRMAEPEEILGAIENFFNPAAQPLAGRKALVTSGPTFEAIDPVRFLGNRSSGKQGHAIAAALRDAGAEVTLISGPVALPDPAGVTTTHVESGAQMMAACEGAVKDGKAADIAICAAAVSDWSVEVQDHKIKKNDAPPTLALKENADILAALAVHKQRPQIVIGFAAETENLLENAQAKLARKGCDMIVANNVSDEKVFGADQNHAYLVTSHDCQDWGPQSKDALARQLVQTIAEFFNKDEVRHAAE